jgi:hypothetical protein
MGDHHANRQRHFSRAMEQGQDRPAKGGCPMFRRQFGSGRGTVARSDVTSSQFTRWLGLLLLRAHQVLGPPTVMLFHAAGRRRREARQAGWPEDHS